MVKYTQTFLKKLEDQLKEGSYEVRYERGNFKSGYCILEAKRVVVINKFSTLESRIQALLEIIQSLSASGELNNLQNENAVSGDDDSFPDEMASAEEQIHNGHPGEAAPESSSND